MGTKLNKLCIIIKALNEEERISACLDSALSAIYNYPGEIILADSGSTDKTVQIASGYPIKIVQLADVNQKCCGIGPQLGYQFSNAEYIYVLDGDMELDRDFLKTAIDMLDTDPDLGGVAGLVEEISTGSVQFRGRMMRNLEGVPGHVKWLDMGGLYRNEALISVGYISNRNFHACEEQDLGLRLSSRGWKLKRIPMKGITHYGHEENTFSLMIRRWRSGYLLGAGEVLRASLGTRHFWSVARIHRHLLVTLGLLILLVAGVLVLNQTRILLTLWIILLSIILIHRIYKHRSLKDALLIVLVWHINAIAMARGFLRKQVDPLTPIDAVVLADNTKEPLNNSSFRA